MHHIPTPLNHHIRDSHGNCQRMNHSHIVCRSQRKALQEPTQSIAGANAKHCKRHRKALQESAQSIAGVNAKHCIKIQVRCMKQKNGTKGMPLLFEVSGLKALGFR